MHPLGSLLRPPSGSQLPGWEPLVVLLSESKSPLFTSSCYSVLASDKVEMLLSQLHLSEVWLLLLNLYFQDCPCNKHSAVFSSQIGFRLTKMSHWFKFLYYVLCLLLVYANYYLSYNLSYRCFSCIFFLVSLPVQILYSHLSCELLFQNSSLWNNCEIWL